MDDENEFNSDLTHVSVGLSSEQNTSNVHNDVPLGIISVTDVGVSLVVARNIMQAVLPALPEQFQFITERGWPILENQEWSMKLCFILSSSNHIRLKPVYEKPRIGIYTSAGTALGFVFIYLTQSLNELRNEITAQLGEHIGVNAKGTYQFQDRNNWPVAIAQETYFKVLDVVHDSCVAICLAGNRSQSTRLRRIISATSDQGDGLAPSITANAAASLNNISRQLTFRRVKDIERYGSNVPALPPTSGSQPSISTPHPGSTVPAVTSNSMGNNSNGSGSGGSAEIKGKQILISYVRAEAAGHALKLKAMLTKHGFSVYLDVDEIQSGEDWQDALNQAVSSCQAFVPLVTSRYGETMWTNREVKLADVLCKPILPVSFVACWPPKCLAIQFATTQFIYWQPIKERKIDDLTPMDISLWQDEDATAVAKELSKRLRLDMQEPLLSPLSDQPQQHSPTVPRHASTRAPHPASLLSDTLLCTMDATENILKQSTLRSCPAKLPEAFHALSQNREGKPMIVISVHPEEKKFATRLQKFLEKYGYEVWCSVQLQIASDEAVSNKQEGGNNMERSYSEGSGALLWTSQCSMTSEDLEGSRKFQEKADQAGVIIVVLSKAFAESNRCKQQVFYCEHRKKIVPIKFEDFSMPVWMSLLIGTGILQNAKSENLEESLEKRIRDVLYSDKIADDQQKQQAAIASAAAILRRKLPRGTFIYISGGTKFYNKESENICKALAVELANMEEVHIVTGGFDGVGRTIAEHYVAECERKLKPSFLWHVLPIKDAQDHSYHAPQNKFRLFKAVNTGITLFSGESVRERECIVAQVFPICILIEGGPGAAHEAEQFAWNDGIVIPVECTGGAASGKFDVPDQIFELPVGVSPKDWYNLRSVAAGPKVIAQSVRNIVETLHKRRLQLKYLSKCLQNPQQSDSTSPETEHYQKRSSSFSLKRGASRSNLVDMLKRERIIGGDDGERFSYMKSTSDPNSSNLMKIRVSNPEDLPVLNTLLPSHGFSGLLASSSDSFNSETPIMTSAPFLNCSTVGFVTCNQDTPTSDPTYVVTSSHTKATELVQIETDTGRLAPFELVELTDECSSHSEASLICEHASNVSRQDTVEISSIHPDATTGFDTFKKAMVRKAEEEGNKLSLKSDTSSKESLDMPFSQINNVPLQNSVATNGESNCTVSCAVDIHMDSDYTGDSPPTFSNAEGEGTHRYAATQASKKYTRLKDMTNEFKMSATTTSTPVRCLSRPLSSSSPAYEDVKVITLCKSKALRPNERRNRGEKRTIDGQLGGKSSAIVRPSSIAAVSSKIMPDGASKRTRNSIKRTEEGASLKKEN